jgi:hypothetical protein
MVDVAKVTPPPMYVVGVETNDGGVPIGLLFDGAPGAAPANSPVIVTNLDSRLAPVVTTSRSNGSFTVNVPMDVTDELRFEAVTTTGRTPPSDGMISDTVGAGLRAGRRHTCLALEPGFSLDLSGQSTGNVVVRNGCSDALSVGNARFRTEGSDFTLVTELPLEIPSGESAMLEYAHVSAGGSASEVVLFVDVTLSGETLRYPITLYANAR